MKSIKFIGILLLCAGINLHAQTSKKVLFIGNSYTAANDLGGLVDSLAIADGNEFIYTVHSPGGQTFKNHTENPATFDYIRQEKWDYVVLQEQSQLPSFPYNQFQKDCVPYAKILVDSIRANNACTIPVFFATWGRRDGDPQFDSINTFNKMNKRLDDAYTYLAKVNGAHKIPVGFAFETVKEPGGGAVSFNELYDSDGSHPSLYGSYITACMFYSHFFNTKSTYNAFNAGYASFYTDFMQGTADYALRADEKNRSFFPKAEFSSENNVGSKTVAFTDRTYGGTAVSWLFGDGDSSKMQNPTHTYPNFELYGVSLYVTNGCGYADTLIRSIRLVEDNQNSMDRFDESTLYVFPNPAIHQLNVAEGNFIIAVYDMHGKAVCLPANKVSSIAIDSLSKGMYTLKTTQGSVQFMKE